MSTTCAGIAPLLLERELGLLEGGQTAALAEHLAACAGCRALLEGHVREVLGAVAAPVDPPADRWEELAERIESDRQRRAQLRVSLACSFCHDGLPRDQAAFCAACLAPHHLDCFRQHARCAAPGCDETRVVGSQPISRPRRRRTILALAMGIPLVAAAAWGVRELTTPSFVQVWSIRPAASERAEHPRAGGDPWIELEAEAAQTGEVCERISAAVQRLVLIDPPLAERVTLRARGPWRDVVDRLARQLRCDVEERPGGLLVLVQSQRVVVRYDDADVREVIRELAAKAGKNVIIGPEVQGRVTLDLTDVHWLRALHAVVKVSGRYELVEENEDLLRVISTRSIAQQVESEMIRFHHATGPAAIALSKLVQQSVDMEAEIDKGLAARVQFDVDANAVLVTGPRPLLQRLKKLIERYDLPAGTAAPGQGR